MKASSWISAVVAAAVLFSGPVMPLVAWAQTQPADQPQVAQATPATPAPAVPAPPPPPPPPKQLMIEPSLIDRQPVPMPYSNLPPAVDPVTSTEPTTGDAVGAGFLNVIYVPGKAIICTAGTLTSVLVMLLTFGSGYRAATGVFNEGCGGDWVLTPEAGALNVKLSNRGSTIASIPPAPGAPTLTSVSLVNYDRQWATDNKTRLLTLWQQTVGRT